MMSRKKVQMLRKAEAQKQARALKARKQTAKRHGLKMMPSGEFVAPKTSSNREYKPTETYRRETPIIPSYKGIGKMMVDRIEPMRYTGTLVKGIATMHKSNAVPVISQEHAEAISKMRRG